MRILSWSIIATGLSMLSFVLTAHIPVTAWPYLRFGFVLTLLGIFLLMAEERDHGG